jgi:hypothetical protein
MNPIHNPFQEPDQYEKLKSIWIKFCKQINYLQKLIDDEMIAKTKK